MLNDRSIWLIARNVARPVNYIALARFGRVYERPLAAAARYFFGSGEYPSSVRVRTPMGVQAVTLYNTQDAITLHEIFCREDYRCPSPPRIVVDLGSNIGISALYFLTQSAETFCELYEPDPHNVSKLMTNLEQFTGRFTLHEMAVADREGLLPFFRESTGRYGHIDVVEGATDEQGSPDGVCSPGEGRGRILARVEHVNTVLDEAISRHGVVDLLKIDTEGWELATVMSIDRELLAQVRHIVIEWFDAGVKLDGFSASSSCDTIMFSNMATVGPRGQ